MKTSMEVHILMRIMPKGKVDILGVYTTFEAASEKYEFYEKHYGYKDMAVFADEKVRE